jgi:hypothetical protein
MPISALRRRVDGTALTAAADHTRSQPFGPKRSWGRKRVL